MVRVSSEARAAGHPCNSSCHPAPPQLVAENEKLTLAAVAGGMIDDKDYVEAKTAHCIQRNAQRVAEAMAEEQDLLRQFAIS